MELFKKYIQNSYRKFFGLILLLIFSVALSTPFPYFSKLIIDSLVNSEKNNNILVYFLFISIIIIIQIIIGRIVSTKLAAYFQKFLAFLRIDIFSERILILEESSQSEVSTIIFNDMELYVNTLENVLTTFVSNIGLFIGYLLFLFRINFKLTFIILLIIPVYVIWIKFVGEKLKNLSITQQQNRDHLIGRLRRFFNGIEVVKVFSLFETTKTSYSNVVTDNQETNTKFISFQNFVSIVSMVIISSTSICIFLIGVNLVRRNVFSVGSLIAFNSYSGLIFSPITQLVNILASMSIVEVYEGRIRKYIDDKKIYNKLNIENERIKQIDLQNFMLISDKRTLIQNVNLTLKTGERVVVIGDNGVGKSLLLKSLANLYCDYGGMVKIKTTNSEYLLSDQVRISPRNIIYLSNNQTFPLDLLGEEINWKLTGIEKLNSIIRGVGLEEKFQKLEFGLETPMESIINSWSLGELQKLRIVRALSYEPDFLILDEILSNIDKATCRKILEMVDILFPKTCIIIVGHHENIKNVDKIFQIKNKSLFQVNCN